MFALTPTEHTSPRIRLPQVIGTNAFAVLGGMGEVSVIKKLRYHQVMDGMVLVPIQATRILRETLRNHCEFTL